jgi:hypothetical protein
MVTSLQIIFAARTGQSVLAGSERARHRERVLADMDGVRSADPAYLLPHNIRWRKLLNAELLTTRATLRAEHPEWTEEKLDWESSPYSPEKLVSVGKDKDGNDFLESESQAMSRWSPYPGMTRDQ